MGIAAYNRGNALISRQLAPTKGERGLETMRLIRDRLNALPRRNPDAQPWTFRGELRIQRDHRGVWWVTPADAGPDAFGFWYGSLEDAVRDWPHVVTHCATDGQGFHWRAALP